MIIAVRKLRELPTDLLRRYPAGLLAVPATGHHVFGKTRREIGGQFRPLERESTGQIKPGQVEAPDRAKLEGKT